MTSVFFADCETASNGEALSLLHKIRTFGYVLGKANKLGLLIKLTPNN